MLFARTRWVGRVLEEAGIEPGSETGRALYVVLLRFSKYCQRMNRAGRGANRTPLRLGPAGWGVAGAMMAPTEPSIADHLVEVLGMSHTEAVGLVEHIAVSALALAERDLPKVVEAFEASL